MTTSREETFSEFKNSFAYGSRSDLNFKFLKRLSDEEAARFFQELLWRLGDSFNDGNVNRLAELVLAWQVKAYDQEGHFTYDEAPFTPMSRPLSAARLLLLTSSGHFVAGHDPEPFGVKEMTQAEAMTRIDEFLRVEPTLSEIPTDTPRDQLRVRHGGYDVHAATADPDVTFPLAQLRELVYEGFIGELANPAYSFVGACAQTPLLKRTGPAWVERFQEHGVDAALLVPV